MTGRATDPSDHSPRAARRSGVPGGIAGAARIDDLVDGVAGRRVAPSDDLPSEAYAAALACLPAMTPHRLSMILRRWAPRRAWEEVRRTRPDPWLVQLVGRHGVPGAWAGAPVSPESVWDRCLASGIAVHVLHTDGTSPTYPPSLAADRRPPAVLFTRGDLGCLTARRAGIVGTRHATGTGRALAHRLGRELAEAGVTVISGLARGVDGHAHRGVLDTSAGRPVAVVASGPDVPFPREHRSLWDAVAERGLLLSEHGPGAPPLAEWFPLRNRILAALSEVVVVVESRAHGGSMSTVREALQRGIGVMAVPGSLLNPAAAGTNRLLADGATAVLDPTDVLLALGLDTRRAALVFDPRPEPSHDDRRVLEAFAGDACSIDGLVERTGLGVVTVAVALGRLEATGWLRSSGAWFEPVDGEHRPQAVRAEADRSGVGRSGVGRSGVDRSGVDRSGVDVSGVDRSGAEHRGQR